MIRVGDIVGQYEIIQKIGAGGMATVYLANHPRLDRQVAIKVMHDAFLQDQNFLTRFEREAQIVAGLEHPNIIPIYDYSEYDGQPYLVMKFIEGQSLKYLLDRSHVESAQDALAVLSPIAQALDYAHHEGVLHRDVKPSNIILDAQNIPYLADFGLARIALAGESTMSQDAILGTPNYISPEQAQGIRNIDGRADQYSLGIIAYQLFVGDVPFNADTPFAIIHDHIYTPLPEPMAVSPTITPKISKVLQTVLAKDPSQRYASCTAFIQALSAAVKTDQFNAIHLEDINITESIAQHRRALRDQANTAQQAAMEDGSATPPILTSAPIDSRSLVTEYRYPRSWMWTLAGFLLSVGMLAGILGTADQIDRQTFDRRVEMMQNQVTLQLEQQADQLPNLTLNQSRNILRTAPASPESYVAAALVMLESGDPQLAQKIIEAGYGMTNDKIQYDLLVAQQALRHGHQQLAFRTFLQALGRAESSEPAQLAVLRNLAGAQLYELIHTEHDISVPDELLVAGGPDIAYIALAQLSLAQQNPPRAEQALEVLAENNTPYEAEYELLMGDWLSTQATRNTEDAEEHWKEALEATYLPAWVEEAAKTRLNSS